VRCHSMPDICAPHVLSNDGVLILWRKWKWIFVCKKFKHKTTRSRVISWEVDSAGLQIERPS
jgi:hypothetical protein